jgi:hypothetical protein
MVVGGVVYVYEGIVFSWLFGSVVDGGGRGGWTVGLGSKDEIS